MRHIRSKSTFGAESGATLLEALAFLAITAIIIIGSVIMLRSAFTKNDVTDTLTQITAIQTAVRSAYSGKNTYGTTDITAGLITSGAFPASMVSGTTVRDDFSGNVTVTGNDRTFFILFTGVDQASCAQVLQSLAAGSFKSLTVNGAPVALPVDVTSSAAACTSASANTFQLESI